MVGTKSIGHSDPSLAKVLTRATQSASLQCLSCMPELQEHLNTCNLLLHSFGSHRLTSWS